MDTRAVIDAYYETVNAGDWESWLTLFDDDVIVDEQIAGHAEGKGAFLGAVDAIRKGYSKFLMHPKHTVVEGEQATVIWHFEGANASGVPMDVMGANYFQVKDGLITYMANFHDKAGFAAFTDQDLS
jgi:ketosteroid isomerase-like protein